MSYENLPKNLKEKEIFGAWRLKDTKERGKNYLDTMELHRSS